MNANTMHRKKGILYKFQKHMKTKGSKAVCEVKQETDLLRLIEQITGAVKKSGSLAQVIIASGANARLLALELKCTEFQAILFALVFNLNFSESIINVHDLAGFIGCEPISMAKNVRDLEELVRLGLLRKDKGERRRFSYRRNNHTNYYIPPDIIGAICEGTRIKEEKICFDSLGELLSITGELFNNYHNNEIDTEELKEEMNALIRNNIRLPFSKVFLKAHVDLESMLIIMMLSHLLFTGNEDITLDELVKSLFHDPRTQFAHKQRFRREEHELLKKEMVCFVAGSFRSEFVMKLTEKFAAKLFAGDRDLMEPARERKNVDLILHQVIPEKPLFYSGEEARNLQFIEEALMPENFKKLRKRLKDKGLCEGVSILLHGPPGTGKTESVYQLARRTGRDIRQIDISETKSYWFGESEKIIKKLFDQYRSMAEKSKVAPILFFNEADGVFCRRRESGRSSTDQTENTIQNIILQEMENLKGILIATTNMVHNLDEAFERRFLYKVPFEKPGMDARFSIWETRLPDQGTDLIRHLAEKYEFTGGEIDNIIRKYTTHQIIKGLDPEPQDIITWCREENMQEEYTKIGFKF